MDVQFQIDSLLKQCAEGTSILQDQKAALLSAPAVHQLIIQDLWLGMQRLIQLRNVLDATPQGAQDTIWAENTTMVLGQVRAQLKHALQVGCNTPAQRQRIGPAPTLIRSTSSSSSSSSSSSTSSTSSLSTSPGDPLLTVNAHIPNLAILDHENYRKRNASGHQPPATQRSRMPFRSKASSSLASARRDIDLFPRVSDGVSMDDTFASDAIVDQPLRIGAGYGSYICYSCTVLSDKAPAITIRKRYSDFVDLQQSLIEHYPHLKSSIPKLPPKRVVGKFTPAFVERRRRDLEYFFKYVVLHPTLGSCPVVTHWITP